MKFDGRDVAFAAGANGRPLCTVNPEIDKDAGFVFEPYRCKPSRKCTSVRVLVLSLSDLDEIPDASLLYTCQVAISPGARTGPHQLRLFNVDLSGGDGDWLFGSAEGGVTVVGGMDGSPADGDGCQLTATSGAQTPWAWCLGLLALLGAAFVTRRVDGSLRRRKAGTPVAPRDGNCPLCGRISRS